MKVFQPRISILSRLALRDLLHGWQSTVCFIVAVVVALIPILILYGLKLGIVTNLIDTLKEDPRVREIRLVRDQPLSAEWFDELEADPRVGFVLPRARYLASSVRLFGPESQKRFEVRMVPTAHGDPYLESLPVPTGLYRIALTERVAIDTGAELGSDLTLEILRIVDEERQAKRHKVTVVAVLPRSLMQTDDIFVSQELESAIERWREGFEVRQLGWEGVHGTTAIDEANRKYASFRLFAQGVRDVPALRDKLLRDGLDIRTRASEVERVLAIESGLGWVFLCVTIFSGTGFLLTLGLHLAASVVEKARELSILRLLGLKSAELSLMPSLQGIAIATIGAAIACLLTFLAQPVVNRAFNGLAGLEGSVTRLEAMHLVFAICATAAAGGLSGCVAGIRAAALEPAQGLRHD